MKQKPELFWDIVDPDWRRRETEQYEALASAIPKRESLGLTNPYTIKFTATPATEEGTQ